MKRFSTIVKLQPFEESDDKLATKYQISPKVMCCCKKLMFAHCRFVDSKSIVSSKPSMTLATTKVQPWW